MFSESKDSKYAYLYNEHYSSFTAENFRSSSSDDYSFKFDGANKPITNNKYDRTICLKKNMNLNQISQDPLNAYCLCESRCADDQTLKSLNQVVAGFTANEDHEQFPGPLSSYCLGCTSNSRFSQMASNSCIQLRIVNPRILEQTLGSKITKRNMRYFRELNSYSYSIENKVEPFTGKQYTAYICRHSSGCTKEFERPWNLLDHIRIHYDVRPHTCPFCSLTFVQKGNRNKHVLIHLKKGENLPNLQDLVKKSDNIFDEEKYIEKYY